MLDMYPGGTDNKIVNRLCPLGSLKTPGNLIRVKKLIYTMRSITYTALESYYQMLTEFFAINTEY